MYDGKKRKKERKRKKKTGFDADIQIFFLKKVDWLRKLYQFKSKIAPSPAIIVRHSGVILQSRVFSRRKNRGYNKV